MADNNKVSPEVLEYWEGMKNLEADGGGPVSSPAEGSIEEFLQRVDQEEADPTERIDPIPSNPTSPEDVIRAARSMQNMAAPVKGIEWHHNPETGEKMGRRWNWGPGLTEEEQWMYDKIENTSIPQGAQEYINLANMSKGLMGTSPSAVGINDYKQRYQLAYETLSNHLKDPIMRNAQSEINTMKSDPTFLSQPENWGRAKRYFPNIDSDDLGLFKMQPAINESGQQYIDKQRYVPGQDPAMFLGEPDDDLMMQAMAEDKARALHRISTSPPGSFRDQLSRDFAELSQMFRNMNLMGLEVPQAGYSPEFLMDAEEIIRGNRQ